MEAEDTASYFDRRAPHYAEGEWHAVYAQRLVELAQLRPGQRVLDAATGTGFAATVAARQVGATGEVVGVDISTGMLGQAERLRTEAGLHHLRFVAADAATLPGFADASFDVVLCAAALLYLPARPALSAWRRVLTPGGVVGFSTMRAGHPVAAQIFRRCAAEFGIQLADPHAEVGDETRCRHMLATAGFRAERTIAGEVWLPDSDAERVWQLHVTSPHYRQIHTLAPSDLAALRTRFTTAFARRRADDGMKTRREAVLYAFGRTP